LKLGYYVDEYIIIEDDVDFLSLGFNYYF